MPWFPATKPCPRLAAGMDIYFVPIYPSPAKALTAHLACLLWKASLILLAPSPSLPLLNHSSALSGPSRALRTAHPV